MVLVVGVALVDWWAVVAQRRTVEYVAKPATMVALFATAMVLTPAVPTMRWWFAAAIALSLVGDVLLMLADDELFVYGLGAFLFGHLGYIGGLLAGGVSTANLAIGISVLLVAALLFAPTIVKGASERDRRMAVPVALYISVISTMVACAIGSGVWAAVVGALLFYASDFVIGWSRFVGELRNERITIITTYHVGQLLLVLSLVCARG